MGVSWEIYNGLLDTYSLIHYAKAVPFTYFYVQNERVLDIFFVYHHHAATTTAIIIVALFSCRPFGFFLPSFVCSLIHSFY